ncbi:MAG: insulinase family protein [Gemmataceae bacterium]|nr:insulinase family protein [Gemmataceae bacterium]
MSFHNEVLPNGLRIIGETSPSARSVSLGFFVRTGARDEAPEVSGVSHFLEHMVFKGTPHRSALEVNRDFDRIGADYNAFTSEENTVFHAAVLPEYLPQSVDILADILRPSLRDEDFDMEKKVIIEEIGMYDDQPMWSAYDQAKRIFFADHPLGNSILGTKESVGGLKREQMHEYFQRRYVASNVMVVVAGNFDWSRFVGLVQDKCGSWQAGPIGRDHMREATISSALKVVPRAKVTQEHVFEICPGPPPQSPLRYAAEALAMAIGDDSGSRLYWELVDPGLADSADTGFHEYDGAGAFYTSFSCAPERTEENLAIVQNVMDDVQNKGITEDELRQAKSKVTSRVVRGNERPKGRMQAIGMTWTYLNEYRTVDDEVQAFDAVDLKQVREVLDRYPINRLTTLALGPVEKLEPVAKNGKGR